MFRIRRFGVVRTSNVAAIAYFLITLVVVIPFALVLAAGPVSMTDSFGNSARVEISPILLLIVPLLYAGLGWVFTALFCLIYNPCGAHHRRRRVRAGRRSWRGRARPDLAGPGSLRSRRDAWRPR